MREASQPNWDAGLIYKDTSGDRRQWLITLLSPLFEENDEKRGSVEKPRWN
ncbi:hypothetical protein HNR48_003664 [Pseudoteredinibacter isoporae]|uniref:Uncharacterized protein n=1 Tax=Pseudoteredinibacter isoporae TaxID=570281 RepID=A0A7X0JW59_9GAMM|nr:hypothetical protein [Pseudoteredinibacter isoporae]